MKIQKHMKCAIWVALSLVIFCGRPAVFGGDRLETLATAFDESKLASLTKAKRTEYALHAAAYYVNRFDLLQDNSEAEKALQILRDAYDTTAPDKDVESLLSYARLRTLDPGLALLAAQTSVEKGGGARAKLMEAWSYWTMATHTVRDFKEGRPVETRPRGYPGEGSLTEAERKEWFENAEGIVHGLLGDEANAPAEVYYLAGLIEATRGREKEDARKLAAAYYEKYVAKATPFHSNFVRRLFCAQYIHAVMNKDLPILDESRLEGEICGELAKPPSTIAVVRATGLMAGLVRAGITIRRKDLRSFSISPYECRFRCEAELAEKHKTALEADVELKKSWVVKVLTPKKDEADTMEIVFEAINGKPASILEVSKQNRVCLDQKMDVRRPSMAEDWVQVAAKKRSLTKFQVDRAKKRSLRLFDSQEISGEATGTYIDVLSFLEDVESTSARIVMLNVDIKESGGQYELHFHLCEITPLEF